MPLLRQTFFSSSLGIALRTVRCDSIRVSPISVRFNTISAMYTGILLLYSSRTQCNLRSEPSSRTTLIGEQPNPWDLLQPQDVMSRHRGAKPPRRYGLLGEISLLSPAYLLSVERWPFHTGPPDHYDRLSSLLDMYVSQSG